jgi:hypothetical protein
MAPEVELAPVLEQDKHVLANVLQLYPHDLSEFRGYVGFALARQPVVTTAGFTGQQLRFRVG